MESSPASPQRPGKPARTTRPSRTAKPAPRARAPKAAPAPPPRPVVLEVDGLRKAFGRATAVDDVQLSVRQGSVFGFVGPNGAGKTTTLSMVAGLLRPDAGTVRVTGIDVWAEPARAKSRIGVLPDRMRLFDRLTGAQMLYYTAVLHGLDRTTAVARADDLAVALGLDGSLERPVRDYSVGMVKKISLAAALVHSPAVLVLDEPFESVDPVSTAQAVDLLRRYAAAGGTVVLSSHNMDLVERVCDTVAVIVGGRILADGTIDEVRDGRSLEERFVELAGGRVAVEGLEWLTTFSA
ncbi:MAG: ABC transporter ATP-binding protein [Microcella sp.]